MRLDITGLPDRESVKVGIGELHRIIHAANAALLAYPIELLVHVNS